MVSYDTMNSQLKSKLVSEIIWLVGIIVASAALEYAIILIFNLHPIFSVKIQALIGLVIVSYVIRMFARMIKQGIISFDDENEE